MRNCYRVANLVSLDKKIITITSIFRIYDVLQYCVLKTTSSTAYRGETFPSETAIC